MKLLLLLVSLLIVSNVYGMSSQTKSPTAYSSTNDGCGNNAVGWGTTSNVAASDNNYSSTGLVGDCVGFPDYFCLSQTMKVTGFSFTLPTNTVSIDSIIVYVEMQYNTGSLVLKDYSARLYKAGTLQSEDLVGCANGADLGTSDAIFRYSFTTTGYTYSDINNSGFGFGLVVGNVNTGHLQSRASIDHIEITVYYTTASDIKQGRIIQSL